MESKTDYDIYLEKYSLKHNIPIEEAREHSLVRLVKQYYEEECEERSKC